MVPNAQEALEVYLKENPAAREEWGTRFQIEKMIRVLHESVNSFVKRALMNCHNCGMFSLGDMSLVGPRPIVRDEIVKYGDYINDFYLVPPGITGVWQSERS